MDYQTVLEQAKKNQTRCRVCPECNGVACKGEIPGVGGKDSGQSFIRCVEALKRVHLMENPLGPSTSVDTTTRLFGKTLAFPLMVAPVAGIRNNYGADLSDGDYNQMVLDACEEKGLLAFTGDGVVMEELFQEGVEKINQKKEGIVTMKPWVEKGITMRLELLKDKHYTALAMDVDAAGLPLLRGAAIPAENKDEAALAFIKKQLGDKPFIVKGIMTVEGALMALRAHADAIVVSTHGGRVCDETLGSIEVLPAIAEAVQGKMTILVDSGFRTGRDIFKALALGADGVLMGRPCTLSVIGGQKEGLVAFFDWVQGELRDAMTMTNCRTLADITREKVAIEQK